MKIIPSGIPLSKVRVRSPECGSVPPAQVRRLGELLGAMDLEDLSGEQRRGLREWCAWLRVAARHDQGLAIFNY